MTDINEYAQYTQSIALATLGEPSSKRSTEWRYGSHGSLSVDVETGNWYDFEAGEGGGPLDLIMRETGRATIKAAISWLEEQGYKQKPEPKQSSKQKARVTNAYDYVDENGELLFQVCRMEPKSFRQRKPKPEGGWSWSVKGVRQVPYRLPDMLAKPRATVLIVEGEKDADALAELGLVATCNAGGAGKWPNDLTPWFKGRKVVFLPDNDDPGRKHATDVATKLSGVAKSVRVVELPGLPEKGDPYDWVQAGGTKQQLVSMCRNASEFEPLPNNLETDPEPERAPEPEPDSPAPFRCLGFDEGHYYYLPKSTKQVVSIPASSHNNKSNLLTIAPLDWFETFFPTKQGADFLQATDTLMRWSERKGTFDATMIRGRGAWFDDGRSVLHLGDRLLVDGEPVALESHDTRYIYERKPALDALKPEGYLEDEEALRLHQITGMLNWQKPVNSALLAGWIALAPICGAMSWRPHIWVTGQRGTGKSWIFDNIISPALGGSALNVQSNSTEAGIRQKLKQDARPVVFDEAEGESQQARHRMQAVLELARQASSDSLAEIAKGTSGGKALSFKVRSMFCMGSINVGLALASDKSRFTVLTLVKGETGTAGRQQFEELESMVNNTLTPEFCAALRARTYRLIPVIRDNARVLSKAAAEHLGNQRAGDQLGALLAGCWSLGSSERISASEAAEWVAGQDWGMDQDEEKDSDEAALASELMHSQIRFDTNHGQKVRSIAEIVQKLTGHDTEHEYTCEEGLQAMTRHGIKHDDGWLVVSESHPEIRKMLSDTPWGSGWARILERINGAERISTTRFAGLRHRAVRIPVSELV